MNIEKLNSFCQALPGTVVDVQWENVLTYKVGGKIYCLARLDSEILKFNLKCDPEEVLDLRERFLAVGPGYHMNKKYWITVTADGSISDNLLCLWIEKSYRLIVDKLSHNQRRQCGLVI